MFLISSNLVSPLLFLHYLWLDISLSTSTATSKQYFFNHVSIENHNFPCPTQHASTQTEITTHWRKARPQNWVFRLRLFPGDGSSSNTSSPCFYDDLAIRYIITRLFNR